MLRRQELDYRIYVVNQVTKLKFISAAQTLNVDNCKLKDRDDILGIDSKESISGLLKSFGLGSLDIFHEKIT